MAREILITIDAPYLDVGTPEAKKQFAIFLQTILEAVVSVNVETLRRYPQIPALYSSGVRFSPEPREWSAEHFDDIPTVLRRGWGDCDDLVAWRIAELRVRNREKATVRLVWKQHLASGKWLYHALVRRKSGTVEDPSKILGMKSDW